MLKRAWKLVCYPLLVILGACLLLTPPEANAQTPNPMGDLSPIAGTVSEDMPTLPADCGLGCRSAWYVQADAFHMASEGGSMSLSQGFALGEFGYELGSRVTLGRRRDCLEGWEATYVGPMRWDAAGELTGVDLYPAFSAAGGVDISAFNAADFQRQTYKSTLHSFELNKRCWDWDTMGGLFGLRYLSLDDQYTFFSRDLAPAEEGFFAVDTANHMIGLQGGLDLFYNVGASGRLSLVMNTKLGLYANFANGDVRLDNAGAVELDNGDDALRLAFLGEIGLAVRYQLTRSLFLRGGYEIWYLGNIAKAPGQTVSPLTSTTGNNLNAGSDNWYQAATVGAELVW